MLHAPDRQLRIVDVNPAEGWFEHHRVSVVIPALNEEPNLRSVLTRVPKWVHEVVLVDGRSTDRTVEVPSYESSRRFGSSKLRTFRDGWLVLKTILRENTRTATPARHKGHARGLGT